TKSQTTPEAGAGTTTLTQQTDGSVVDDKGNKVETAAQALSIDPHQLVKLPDGSTAPWHQVIGGTLLKAKYDERVGELNKEKEKVAADKQTIAQAKGWLDLADKDPGASAYLVTLNRTNDPQKALQAAQAALGVNPAPVTPATPSKPQPGSVAYYLQDQPDDLTPGTPEYDVWYGKHLYHGSAKGAQDAIEADRAKREEEAAKQRAAEEEEARKRNEASASATATLQKNEALLKNAHTYLLAERKFDPSTLTPEQQKELGAALTASALGLKVNVTDREWLSKNPISENDMSLIVLKADLSAFTAKKAAPEIPTLAQSKLDVAPNPPISAGPVATNAVPSEAVHEDDGVFG